MSLVLCSLLVALKAPTGPVEFGRAALDAAMTQREIDRRAWIVDVRTEGRGADESYRIHFDGTRATVYGIGANGTMYGELELAERIKMHGATAWGGKDVVGKPYLHDRGLNVFLTLPWNYEKNDTDYDPKALVDPDRWWFQNEDYWTTLLDLMAKSRFNWLDLHGMWDISVTDAPNLYAYFIQSEKYPKVGVDPAVKAANLRQLNHVLELAHARGIRVSLMAYQANIAIPQNARPPYKGDEATLYDYTREMVEKAIRQIPKLDAIGFRIGESGKGEEFFNCYHEAVKRSGRDIPLITRSWITTKQKVLPLARGSKDFTVEIKYNGEQWAAPYMIAGGRVANWYSYSFEDYLSDSGAPGAKTWPGNPTSEGGSWPSEPYKIVWQVRANGTHRIFPFYNPDWVRRTIETMKIGTTSGYTIEPMDAYFPKSPKYYLRDPKDQYCNWCHQRDEMYISLWGRMGYDPSTPEDVFQARISEWFGDQGVKVADAWKTASEIVPLSFMAYSLGPDHRSQAPELEYGGDVNAFVQGEGFDSFVFRPVKEAAAYEALGIDDGREDVLSPSDVDWGGDSSYLRTRSSWAAAQLRKVNEPMIPPPSQGRFKELKTAMTMESCLGDYFDARLSEAASYVKELAPASVGRADVRTEVSLQADRAVAAWKRLASSTSADFYRPFTDRLRMHTNSFHWASQLPAVEANRSRLPFSESKKGVGIWSNKSVLWANSIMLSWSNRGSEVVCSLPVRGRLLVKPLPSSTFFHAIPMVEVSHNQYRAYFPRKSWGHLVAAEIDGHRVAGRDDGPPYLTIPSLPGPTPQIYSAEEALTYFDPKTLTPDCCGLIVLATRAAHFFNDFGIADQRKILAGVEKGVSLVIFQEDFTRYPLKWLPNPPRIGRQGTNRFDPGGALGLAPVDAEGVMYQPIQPTPGWEVFGNGGIARTKFGKGEIWICQARLMQTMYMPGSAKAMAALLKLGDKTKPVCLVDSGSEGAAYASAVFPDLMNALGIPFLTLGEFIAEHQGMNSFKKIPGPVWNDSVLGGKGSATLHKFLEEKVKSKAARPIPATRGEHEKRRIADRQELMRDLGLDPLPPRTSMNPRITGVLLRQGYRVENLVLDSRPNFPVTANIYIPSGVIPGQKYPVIMNPHGHWQHKKAEPVVQARAIFMALHGYIAVVVDTPGQSFEGPDTPIERRFAGDHNDFQLVLGSANTTAIYVWDMMRVMDYLETRPDTDMSRVGITGASGGGLGALFAFAADDRYKVAVPVVYASSMEVNPDNGCLCNHVPGMLNIGDRADVLAIRAPAPVFIIGAHDDVEFPPDGMKLSGEKLAKLWGLYGASEHTRWKLYAGPHDYNKLMREDMIGFFDKELLGKGDGSPVPEPPIVPEPPESKELVCMPTIPAGLSTMRDIGAENLSRAAAQSFARVVEINGGLPAEVPLDFKLVGKSADGAQQVTFVSEAGLQIPGILRLPAGKIVGGKVFVSERGKTAAETEFKVTDAVQAGYATLCVDVRGFGELSDLDQRLMTYLGTADAFAMGWDVKRAVEVLRRWTQNVGVVGSGPTASQAVMFAALMDRRIASVVGLDGLRDYIQCYGGDVSEMAVQPRADLSATLQSLRDLLGKRGTWTFRGDPSGAR